MKVKALKSKGLIIGAIWGLVSGVAQLSGLVHSSYIVNPMLSQLLFAPIYLGFYLSKLIGLGFILLIFAFPLAILIGALIGYGIEKIIRR